MEIQQSGSLISTHLTQPSNRLALLSSGLEKFNYVGCFLDGEASHAIAGLSITNDNYKEVSDLLKNKFGLLLSTFIIEKYPHDIKSIISKKKKKRNGHLGSHESF